MQRTSIEINYSPQEEMIARFAKALSHPAQSTISQHLKELKEAGLIQGDVMPPRVKYCINQKAWSEAKNAFAVFFDK